MTKVGGIGEPFDVVVVGGGFSGVMVAINIAQRAASPLRVAVIERKDELGRGVAFAATPRDAILNVPAVAMGAFPDQPDDFLNWLRSLLPKSAAQIDPKAYYPRQLYGAYVGSLMSDAERAGHDITCLSANIVDYARTAAGVALLAQDGRCVAVGAQVVLALGGPPPADIMDGMGPLRDHPRYVRDPWVFLKRHDFDACGEIVIVGSGLTALDVIAAFAKTGYANKLVAVSRGGRFPQSHEPPPDVLFNPIPPGAQPATIREIFALVRAAVRRAADTGHDWRAVIDGLRPEIQRLWIGLSLAERRRYLRHVRAIYDPHRHRAPASVLRIKDDLTAAGQLRTIAGRIVGLTAAADAIDVTILGRNDQQFTTIAAAQIINCGGPGNNYASGREPLIARLLQNGDVAPDPSGMGVRALANGRLIDGTGAPQRDLYTIGWPMRGVLLESTAVRELRGQARILAEELIASMPATAVSNRVVA
jgi:uncharacterized NAD(P)/FAD-binding protein YdhS